MRLNLTTSLISIFAATASTFAYGCSQGAPNIAKTDWSCASVAVPNGNTVECTATSGSALVYAPDAPAIYTCPENGDYNPDCPPLNAGTSSGGTTDGTSSGGTTDGSSSGSTGGPVGQSGGTADGSAGGTGSGTGTGGSGTGTGGPVGQGGGTAGGTGTGTGGSGTGTGTGGSGTGTGGTVGQGGGTVGGGDWGTTGETPSGGTADGSGCDGSASCTGTGTGTDKPGNGSNPHGGPQGSGSTNGQGGGVGQGGGTGDTTGGSGGSGDTTGNGGGWNCDRSSGTPVCHKPPTCATGTHASACGACVPDGATEDCSSPSTGGCWITGGGFIVDGDGKDTFGGNAMPMKSGTIRGQWEHVDHGTGNKVHGEPSYIVCRHVDEPGPGADNGPKHDFTTNQAYFGGEARVFVNNGWFEGYWFDVMVEDHGEGKGAKAGGPDYYHMTIRKMTAANASGVIVYDTEKNMSGGNIQLHPPNNGHPYTSASLPSWVSLQP